jgi:hypothetical protein
VEPSLVTDGLVTVPLEGVALPDCVDGAAVVVAVATVGWVALVDDVDGSATAGDVEDPEAPPVSPPAAPVPAALVPAAVVLDAVVVAAGLLAWVERRLTPGLGLKPVVPIAGAAVPELSERLRPELDNALPGEPPALKTGPDDRSPPAAPVVASPASAVAPALPFATTVFPAAVAPDAGSADVEPA